MNIIGEKQLKINDKEYTVRLTKLALYRTQLELNFDGFLQIIHGLDRLDLRLIYVLLKHSIKGKEFTVDELLEADIEFHELLEYLGESLAPLFEKKDGKVLEKK